MLLFPLRPVIHWEAPGGPGGSGGTPAAPPQPPAPSPGPPAPAAPPATPPAPGAAAPQKPTFEQWIADPTNAEFTKKLRDEAASNRIKANKAGLEALRPLADMMGVELPAGEQQNDPAAILKQFQERDAKREAQVRDLLIDNTLKDLYVKHAVHPDLTKGQLMMAGVLKDLDPTGVDFKTTLDGAVKKLAETMPQIKTAAAPPPPPRRTSAPMQPNGDAKQQLTLEEVRKMKPDEVEAARKAGQLDEVLGRNK